MTMESREILREIMKKYTTRKDSYLTPGEPQNTNKK